LAALALLPVRAQAAPPAAGCSVPPGWQPIVFPMPAALMIPPGPPVAGTILYTSPPISRSTTTPASCAANPANGLMDYRSAPLYPAQGVIPQPINNAGGNGIAFIISYNGVALGSAGTNPPSPGYAAYPITLVAGDSVLLTGASVLQIVETGEPITLTAINGGELAQWMTINPNGAGAAPVLMDYQLGGTTKIGPQACAISATPVVVTLPSVGLASFTGTGSVTGKTKFTIDVQCPANTLPMQVTLAPGANGVVGPPANGVLANTPAAGNATNVGVQLLNHNGTPVDLGCTGAPIATPPGTAGGPNGQAPSTCATPVGNTAAGGAYKLPYAAQYYQTAGDVTPGQVHTTAIYTISYR
jgi:type 1 fimbria pilin